MSGTRRSSFRTSEGGEVKSVLVVSRDITERRQMLASLAEKERLASVGMLAASVAHEIMNPLTYVLANLDFVVGERSDEPARNTKALVEAREGARRMQQIVWDLRALGRTGGEELFYVDARTSSRSRSGSPAPRSARTRERRSSSSTRFPACSRANRGSARCSSTCS